MIHVIHSFNWKDKDSEKKFASVIKICFTFITDSAAYILGVVVALAVLLFLMSLFEK